MSKKNAVTSVEINTIAKHRWSPRAFEAGRQVEKKQLIALAEAARWSPSCYNDQAWRVLICDKFSDISAWEKMLSCLGEWNQRWANNAPVLIAMLASEKFSMNGKENRWAQYDTGAAALSICFEAEHQGLSSHQMGGFDEKKLLNVFNIEGDFTPMTVIAIGYLADYSVLEEDFHKAELADRERFPMANNFYLSSWGSPINNL